MTPKEKADELYVGYWYLTNDSRIAKQCALICLEELFINNTKESKHNYWIDVKEEIEKL